MCIDGCSYLWVYVIFFILFCGANRDLKNGNMKSSALHIPPHTHTPYATEREKETDEVEKSTSNKKLEWRITIIKRYVLNIMVDCVWMVFVVTSQFK